MARKGYWVVCYKSIENPTVFAEYQRLARIALEASGRVIVGGQPAKVHEAGLNQLDVIVEFDNLQTAAAAYESELYKVALKVLGNTAQRDFRIIEGV
jgi:uncharacterized protein (DUF1330 family)